MLSINSSFIITKPILPIVKPAAKVQFCGTKNDDIDLNSPINKFGEYSLGIQKCFYKSLRTAANVFAKTAYYSSFSSDDIGSSLGMSAVIGVIAGIGTFLIQFPKDLYDSHVNFFAKKHQSNVDLANYSTEKTLFKQIEEKGKTANQKEKQELANNFMKMQMSKSKLTDYKNFTPFNETKQKDKNTVYFNA